VEALKASVERAGGTIVAVDGNPIDAIWKDQPGPPLDKAMPYPAELAGESSEQKRTRIADAIKKQGADAAVLTLPDSICWLLNMRGSDVSHTPFVLSFAIHNADGSTDLFMDGRKSSPELVKHFGNAVRLHEPEEFPARLDALKGKTVIADPNMTASFVADRLKAAGAKVKRAPDPCQLPKACKNAAEVEGARKAHIRDGAALTRFLAWFEREAPKGQLDEIKAAETLEGFRREVKELVDLSFDSISGAGPHAALPHYRVTRSTNRKINNNEIYLIDSGGQYADGTTDVTRTMIVGRPSEEMRDRFTRVLKGHIALAVARFPEGTPGAALDCLARKPLWDAGLDYDHGTGHGVGAFLSVHEGPQNISKKPITQALMPGMICSNEPGYYKEGEYGIRIENLVVVTQPEKVDGGERPMMRFETITMAPIDLHLVEPRLLTEEERGWLNWYHGEVRKKVGPLLSGDSETLAWFEQATRPI
jgi:Xaa-Pro aminopeptidase